MEGEDSGAGAMIILGLEKTDHVLEMMAEFHTNFCFIRCLKLV